VVAAVVAERQFDGASAEGQTEELAAHADAEDRDPPDQLGDKLGGTYHRCRISRPVRQQHAGVTAPAQLLNRDPGWYDPHREAFTDEAAEDRAFDTEIDHRNRRSIGVVTFFKGV